MAFLSTAGVIYFFIKSNEILSLDGAAAAAASKGIYLSWRGECKTTKAFANKIPMNA